MIRIVLLAPIDSSLYSRILAVKIFRSDKFELAGIAVRTQWNFKRFKAQYKRDGAQFIKNIYDQLLLADDRFSNEKQITLKSYSHKHNISEKSLKKFANKNNIPILFVQDQNNNKSLAFLRNLNPEVIIFSGGGLIRQKLLAVPKYGVLNCHPGILPQYRGMNILEWTALDGNISSIGFGVTLHFLDKGVDTGPILLQRSLEIKEFIGFRNIREQLEVLKVDLMLEGIQILNENSLKPEIQKMEDGKQYFVMHPRLLECARRKLSLHNLSSNPLA